jgi:hypothetical protein
MEAVGPILSAHSPLRAAPRSTRLPFAYSGALADRDWACIGIDSVERNYDLAALQLFLQLRQSLKLDVQLRTTCV